MRVVVTGATGFLGRRVIDRLVGHDVLCLTRDVARVAPAPGRAAAQVDLRQPSSWTGVVAAFQPECAVHLAWDGLPDYSLDRCRLNVDVSLRLWDHLSAVGVRRVVAAGSCWEYGDVVGAAVETQPPGPLSTFAAAKRGLQMMLEALARERGFDWAWARVFFSYGAGQRDASLIPTLYQAYAEGREPVLRAPGAAQDFVHADDVAEALVALAHADASGCFNVGSGRLTSVGTVANIVARLCGRPATSPEPAAVRGLSAEPRHMIEATGWRARISLEDGIAQTVAQLAGARVS